MQYFNATLGGGLLASDGDIFNLTFFSTCMQSIIAVFIVPWTYFRFTTSRYLQVLTNTMRNIGKMLIVHSYTATSSSYHFLYCSICIDAGHLHCKAEQRKSCQPLPSFCRHHRHSSSLWSDNVQLQSTALPPWSHYTYEPKAKNLIDDFHYTHHHPWISLPHVIHCRLLAFL